MAKKFSDFQAITGAALADTDLLAVSDLDGGAPDGGTRSITAAELKNYVVPAVWSVSVGGTGANNAADARANLAAAGTGVANTFSATQTIQSNNDGANPGPDLNLYRNSASPTANDFMGRIRFSGENSIGGTVFGYVRIQGKIIDPTSGSEDALLDITTTIAGTPATRLNIGHGIYTPNATGGDQGADSINASAVFDDGSMLTPYVLEFEQNGAIDMSRLDRGVPNLELPEKVEEVPVYEERTEERVSESLITLPNGSRIFKRRVSTERIPKTEDIQVFDEQGRPTGETRKAPVTERRVTPAETKVRTHGPARRFAADAATELDPRGYSGKWKTRGHLPALPSEAEWLASNGKIPMGRLVQSLMETVEVQAVHIDRLCSRIEALEIITGVDLFTILKSKGILTDEDLSIVNKKPKTLIGRMTESVSKMFSSS